MEVERLRQIFVKSGLQSEFPVPVLLARGQRDRFLPWLTLLRFRHQLEPVAIGQSNIARQDFKTQVPEQDQRVLYVRRGRDLMATVGQET